MPPTDIVVTSIHQLSQTITLLPDETLHLLLRDRVALIQARSGYRTSVDAMLLAHFAWQQAPDSLRIADLGAGTGLLSLLLGLALPDAVLHLFELQPQMLDRAMRNAQLQGLQARVHGHLQDLAQPLGTTEVLDLVVCNPPYYQPFARQLPKSPERRLAHCESTADLHRFCQVASTVADHGVTCWVYPEASQLRLLQALSLAGLRRISVAQVYHRQGDSQPVRVLVAARHGEVEQVQSLPDRFIHPADALDQVYSPEIEAFLQALPRCEAVERQGLWAPSTPRENV